VDKFEEVMMMIKQHAVAMDANLTSFTRVWVLLELHEAIARGMQTHYCGTKHDETLASLTIPSAETAEASVAADKARILAGIRKSPGGVAAFDVIMSANINKEMCFNESGLLPGRGHAVLEAVRFHPAIINSCSSRGLGGTLLMLAAVHGVVERVQKLIEAAGDAIDLNKQTSDGWTALHYAAVCFTSAASSLSSSLPSQSNDRQYKIVAILLDAGCEQLPQDSIGRVYY